MLLSYIENSRNDDLEHFVCTLYDKGPLKEAFLNAGVQVYSLKISRKLFFPLAFPKFALLLRKINPDAIHSYLVQESLVNRIVGTLFRKPVICGKRDPDTGKPSWKIWLDRSTIWLADLNISNSKEGCKELLSYGIPSKKIIYIPNGKDIFPFEAKLPKGEAKKRLGFGKEDILLGCVSRLFESKGQEYLVRAMPHILRKNPRAKAVFIGGGNMLSYLESISKELGVSDNIVFLGERRDLPEVLRAFDMFIFPSLREGMPGALMEAMAAGLPIVATHIVGVDELIQDEENGLLVTPANSKEIADCVLRLLQDSKLSSRLGENARKTIENDFTVEKMAERLDEVYLKYGSRV